jgi:hypothetical protein
MSRFLDRVEKRVEKKRRQEDLEEKRRWEAARATVPDLTFEIDILDVDLPEHILYILQEAGYETLGDLVLQMRLDSDTILALNGIGPKAFEKIEPLTDALRVSPEEQTEPVEVVEGADVETPVPAEAPEAEALEAEAPEAEAPEADEVPEAELPETETAEAEAETVEETSPEPVETEPAEEVEETEEVVRKKPVVDESEEEDEDDDFDELFSYDASKYGYYEPEKPELETDEDFSAPKSGKKKRKKRFDQDRDRKGSRRKRTGDGDWDEWEEW